MDRCNSFIEGEAWADWGAMGQARSCLPFSICEGAVGPLLTP